MDYLYGLKWHPRQRHPIREMTEKKARAVFDNGPQLGVIALPEPGGVPAYTLELNAGALSVSVKQYDANGSVVAQLGYRVLEGDDRLFLTDVAEWLYADDGEFHDMGAALAFRQYFFTPAGTAKLRSRVKEAEAETVEEVSDVDVSDHWVDRIGWGDWDRIGLHRPKGPQEPG